jgi:hypothetical protein
MVHFTEDQIKHIADRFLGWRVPSNFNPDAGISYTPARQLPGIDRRPYGTNLLDVEQATAMVRYILDGLPAAQQNEPVPVAWLSASGACTSEKCIADVWQSNYGITVEPLYAAPPAPSSPPGMREALEKIAKEVFTDGTPTKAARTAKAVLCTPPSPEPAASPSRQGEEK